MRVVEPAHRIGARPEPVDRRVLHVFRKGFENASDGRGDVAKHLPEPNQLLSLVARLVVVKSLQIIDRRRNSKDIDEALSVYAEARARALLLRYGFDERYGPVEDKIGRLLRYRIGGRLCGRAQTCRKSRRKSRPRAGQGISRFERAQTA
jgi:hypothetical protein